MRDYIPKDVKAVITRGEWEGDLEVMRLDQRIRDGKTLHQKLDRWYSRLEDVASWPSDKYARSDYLRQALHAIADIELQIMVTFLLVDKRGEE